MLEATGFEVLERGCVVSPMEPPDAEPAWRALAGQEPAVPALRHGDPAAPRRGVLAATDRCSDHRGLDRLRNDHQFVIVQRPRRNR
jgi:hypothetical protein